jgi:hypothetical protein
MQVRTGKTLTSLNIASLYGAKKVLFVTKKKAISSIESDYESMFKDDYKLFVYNYEQLHNFNESNIDLIIIDEAHSLGQFPVLSQRTKLLKKICFGLPIIYLSGTPTPESYSQLFHQFYISSFSPFGDVNFYKWVKEGFVTVTTKYLYNRQINDYSNANKQLIDEKTKHLFVSFTQEEAGFEQLVDEEIHYVLMDRRTHTLADIMRKKRVFIGKNGEEVIADTEVKLMQKLHQIYSGSVLTENKADYVIFDNSKANYIYSQFSSLKVAIFYKFRAEKEILVMTAAKYSVKLTESPEEFNENADLWFICQVQSGREGINLSSADCLVMYNIDFSAVSYWQVRARLQTKDREKTAKVHWIFAKDGIEPRIYNAVSNKKDYTLSYFKKEEKL